ncbi:MAG: tautomerase family protein [Deltaproteobacteria bacterium]|nr:MAG: tautomerase family protein [Deltaproteobacteria bacterium]TMB33971.1 MAG: tautomerase family protein [Deltaproteobacteria bacterium]
MPLVRIALRKGKSPEYRRAISESIHRAMVETIKIPEQDRFQIVTEHDDASLVYDPSYLGISRSDGVILVQITLSAGRTVDVRKALFARIVQLLRESPGVRPEDVFVSLVEVAKENWSFGNGVAQYAT